MAVRQRSGMPPESSLRDVNNRKTPRRHQIAAIRSVRTSSASASAAQTIRTGVPSGTGSDRAAAASREG